MADERFDKLLHVMLEVKGTVDEIKTDVNHLKTKVDHLETRVGKLEEGQKEIIYRLDKLEDSVELLAQKNWSNEKEIHRLKRAYGIE